MDILATLLHYANASPPSCRTEFYRMKERLLKRYGTFCGHDLQEIRKECWGELERNDDWYDRSWLGCTGASCRRCGGTGVFDIRWVRLQRWTWGKYTFHIPDGETRKPPDMPTPNLIRGLIEHPNYGRASNEAVLWLYLLFDRRLFWRSITGWCCYGRYFYPLTILQRIAMPLRWRLSWQRCLCGKLFFTWGSGWQICRKCRSRSRDREDVPF